MDLTDNHASPAIVSDDRLDNGLKDDFGRAVIASEDGTSWSVTHTDGAAFTVEAASEEAALRIVNALAPADFKPAPRTMISPEDFINRFAADEQQAAMQAAAKSWRIELLQTKAFAAAIIDVTSIPVLALMAALVDAGALKPDRSAQILDLSQTSPPAS